MQVLYPDAFALRNSGLGTFLYADGGVELNGSMLTVLSMLARLGRDPWAEAARWAALPRAAVIDSLAESIAQMPLAPAPLAASQATAVRLIELLPAQTQTTRDGPATETKPKLAVPKLAPGRILYWALVIGIALNALLAPRHAAEPNEPLMTPAESVTPQSAFRPVPGS